MTKEQFNNIISRLNKWLAERGLTKEHQRVGYLGNIYEEISEYYRAENMYEKLDAIMDIAVFTLNTFEIRYPYDDKRSKEERCKVEKIKEGDIGLNVFIRYITDHQYDDFKNYDKATTMIEILELLTSSHGFDFYTCMLETINEISSRTGCYDTKIKKFIKDKGAYTLQEANKGLVLPIKYKEDKDYWYFLTLTGRKKIKKWHKAQYK